VRRCQLALFVDQHHRARIPRYGFEEVIQDAFEQIGFVFNRAQVGAELQQRAQVLLDARRRRRRSQGTGLQVLRVYQTQAGGRGRWRGRLPLDAG
jgi:hypothetical protein